jgi:hypothetical protein
MGEDLTRRFLTVRCGGRTIGGDREKGGLIASPELFSALALIEPLRLLSGRKLHDLVAALGANPSPRSAQTPFLKESRLQGEFVVAVAVTLRLDEI